MRYEKWIVGVYECNLSSCESKVFMKCVGFKV